LSGFFLVKIEMRTTLLLSLFCLLFVASCETQETESQNEKYVHIPPELPDSVFSMVQAGDIILRKGNGPLSFHLMHHTKENYSHCGIIVEHEGKKKIIHTIGGSASEDDVDGIQFEEISKFVAHAADSMLFICRPVFKDSAGPAIADAAFKYLEQEVPFDHSFSLYTPDKLYCSELLYYIFKDVNGKNLFDVQKKHKSYMLMFSTFFDTSKFEPVFHLCPDEDRWYTLSE